MFTLLVPVALAGLAFLAVPVILHLFKPRRVRVVPFSSLRWLHASQHRLSRRIQWHQVLLFLLRAALIVFLTLALARPIFSGGRARGQAERIVVLDLSRSMAYRLTGKPSPAEAGRALAADLLTQGLAGDRTALILAGRSAEVVSPLVDDPSAALAPLRAAAPGAADADLGAAMELVPALLASKRADAMIDLFWITDNQAHAWAPGPIARFLAAAGGAVRVRVVDVGPDRPQNAWIAEARLTAAGADGRRTIRASVSAVAGEALERTVRLTIPGAPEEARRLAVEPGRVTSLDFEVPAGVDVNGKVARLSLDPADGLPDDDVYWVNLDARGSMRVLVVEPETTHVPELQPGHHLRAALASLSDGGSTLRVAGRSDRSVRAGDVSDADVVFLADVPSLDPEVLAALENRVKAGGGLAVFTGANADRTFYGTRFHDPLRAGSSLLPGVLGGSFDRKAGGELGRVTDVDWSHPLLRDFYDPAYGDLAQARFLSYARIDLPADAPGVHVLARIDHQAPALIERRVGEGCVLWFNTTANDTWSDLPRRASFVPLIDRALRHLAGGVWRGAFEAGEAVVLPVPRDEPGLAASVVTPSGARLQPELRTVGGRVVAAVGALDVPGVYRLETRGAAGSESRPFVVQAGRRDSALAPMNERVLKRWWSPAGFEVLRPDVANRRLGPSEMRVPLDPWMMLAALLAFLAEMVLVHTLCPRSDPRIVSEPLVTRHGFFGAERKW